MGSSACWPEDATLRGGAEESLTGALERFYGCPAVPTSSGTAAIHAILLAAGIGPGDEVIVPAYTFMATALPVLAVGADVVFADVGTDLNLDPEAAAAAIGPRTAAIIAADLHGILADWPALRQLADRGGLLLVQDACAAAASARDGKRPGAFADAAALSFNWTKIVPAGEGGAVLSRVPALREGADRAIRFGEGQFVPSDERGRWLAGLRVSQRLGLNMKLGAPGAAAALRALEALPERVRRARSAQRRVLAAVEEAPTLRAVPAHPGAILHKLRVWGEPGDEERAAAAGLPVSRSREVAPLPVHPVFEGARQGDNLVGSAAASIGTFVIGTPTEPIFALNGEGAARWADGLARASLAMELAGHNYGGNR